MRREPSYIVAYDICNPKRLRRVARGLERHAVRCQKSVFIFRGSEQRLSNVLGLLAKDIDPKVDVIQAWRLHPGHSVDGICKGNARTLFPKVAVLGHDSTTSTETEEDQLDDF